MIKVKQWCKSNGLNKIINEVATEAEAIDFVIGLLSDFEKEETKRLQSKGALPSNGYYSKHYFYYIIEQ